MRNTWFLRLFIIFFMMILSFNSAWSQSVPSGINDSSFICITWGKDKFVAGSNDGKIISSLDGKTWTIVENSSFGESPICSIVYANEVFVAVGYNGKISVSLDGILWNLLENSIFGNSNVYDISFGNGKFVAVGDNGKIAISFDGYEWELISNSPFIDSSITNIAFGEFYDGGKFVISRSGRGNVIAVSSDAENWIIPEASFSSYGFAYIYDIAFGAYRFIAVGNTGNDAGFIYASNDGGVSWELVNFGIFGGQGFDIISIAWGGNDTYWWSNSRFVAVGSGGALGISDYSGRDWVSLFTPNPYPRNVPNPRAIHSVTYANGLFVGVGEKGRISISSDGISWTDYN